MVAARWAQVLAGMRTVPEIKSPSVPINENLAPLGKYSNSHPVGSFHNALEEAIFIWTLKLVLGR